MPGRSYSTDSYRYGFNGYEKDDEVKGSGNYLSFGDYGYDTRLMRRWNIDPVVKHHESPYAAFANNPIWFADENGLDTLVVHRSGPIAEMSDGNATFYIITFSIISNNVSTPLQGRMLMMGNAKSEESIPHTALPNSDYKLTVQDMPSHSQFDGNAINVVKGVYIHAGNLPDNFAGCLGVCEDLETTNWSGTDENGVTTSTAGLGSNTKGAVGNIIEMRNTFDKILDGDKFILRTNSSAPEMQKMVYKPASGEMQTMKAKPAGVAPRSTKERSIITR